MQKTIFTLLFFLLLCLPVTAATTFDVVLDKDGQIQIDDKNPRQITGCWDSDEQAVMFYRSPENTITHAEICNEPDELHHGLGLSDTARALNYYEFLDKTDDSIQAKIVLGSLSGYNYQFIKEFLKLPNACEKFDVLSFHPYHLGVAPDEIDIAKNSYHTVTQWVNFYREILRNAGCEEKPIWVTEFGFTTQDYDAEKAVSETEQIDFALKQLIMLLGEKVERVSYFNKLSFALSDAGVEMWNDLARKLAGSTLESFKMTGEDYCPRPGSCFYDENEFRLDEGQSIYGLEATPNSIKKERRYTFQKDDGSRVFVSWETEKPGISIKVSPFSDVTLDTHYASAILGISEKGLINGYPDKTFQPNKEINRAEFLKILVEATKQQDLEINGGNCFPDVKNEWFAPYVCYAKARNWITGYPDGNFLPSNKVNRAEALKMIANAFGWETTPVDGAWYLPFSNAAISKNVLLQSEAADFGKAQNRGFISEMIWRTINQ